MTASTFSEAAGLLLFALAVFALHLGHRAYVRLCRRRLLRAAGQPLPGRTRDLFPPTSAERVS